MFRIFTFFIVISLAACASQPIDQVYLMPAPDVFGDGLINPLPEHDPFDDIPYKGILYATDRQPSTPTDKEKYYLNKRGQMLRLGVAFVEIGGGKLAWEKEREISILTKRTEKLPIKVTGIEEWGMLKSTVPFWINLDLAGTSPPPLDATVKFTKAINAQLARSDNEDVYIFVHGFKVVYENPLLISSELWHFLGYDGVFIAYAWPSTPSKFAYIKDSDTSGGYARNLRLLIESIAKNTNVKKIHLLGYSNGTRLILRAMEQLALIHQGETADEIHQELRIGSVILAGSDIDRGVFGSYIADGILDVSQRLTIYLSGHDKALGISAFISRRKRLGQMWSSDLVKMTPSIKQALLKNLDKIDFINVTPTEGASTGNGHGYFLSSPWVSSDVLMTLYYGLAPEERGLVQHNDLPFYDFPPDYITRLWSFAESIDPEFAENYRAYKKIHAKKIEQSQ